MQLRNMTFYEYLIALCDREEKLRKKRKKEEQMKEKADTPFIEYKNSLGWRGTLYGKSSMSICDPGGREILHTSSRKINTLEELIRYMNCTEFTTFSGQQN